MEMSAAVDDSRVSKLFAALEGAFFLARLMVEGETRIVTVQDVFLALAQELFDGVSIIKYQQPDEDLYALVSIVNDEDAMNMKEYDKDISVSDGPTWLRIFLISQYIIGMHYDADDRGGELSRGELMPSTSSSV